jgi:hypothetical protein
MKKLLACLGTAYPCNVPVTKSRPALLKLHIVVVTLLLLEQVLGTNRRFSRLPGGRRKQVATRKQDATRKMHRKR